MKNEIIEQAWEKAQRILAMLDRGDYIFQDKSGSARHTLPVLFSPDKTEVYLTGENTNRIIIQNAAGKG